MFGDVDRREHVFGAYNQYISEVCAQATDRLYFVGIPNYWDTSATRASVDELKRLGARCLMVPIGPRKDAHGDPIHYANPSMEPFWAAVGGPGCRSASISGRTSRPASPARPQPSR